MAETTRIRILIADDQQDIIDALRLLLTRRGLRGHSRTVAGRGARTARGRRLRSRPPRSQLHTRHHVGAGRLRPDGTDPRAGSDAAGPRHDGVEQRRGSGRGDAPRRPRLHREAVGRREGCWRRCGRRSSCAGRCAATSGCRRPTRACSVARRRRSSARRPASGEIRQTIERVAPSDASVLITGEHGTGKEVVAAWLHALSIAAARPLVTMNAGGLAEGIAESELFGHVKGAFTDARVDRIGCFEMADEGTLFLDEIANMPIRLQAKLLRVLQTGEIAARRLVAAALRQRARALGDQRRPAGGDRGGAVPRRSALSAQHRRHSPAAAARAARRRRRARRAFPGTLRRALPQAARRRSTRTRCDAAGAHLARQRPRAGAQRSSAPC